MANTKEYTEKLKDILENIHNPAAINAHPWTKSVIVQATIAKQPGIRHLPPGQQLISAIAGLFSQMMPSTPPKRGIRLDTRWGEFGLLAAIYFAPIKFGAPYPNSLRDAWGRIDQAILMFVNGVPGHSLPEKVIERYKLVSDEPYVGPASTISDWHRRGVERLAQVILNEEQRLLSQRRAVATRTRREDPLHRWKFLRPAFLWMLWISLLSLVLLLAAGGWQVWQVYQRAQAARQHAAALLAFSTSYNEIEQLESTGKHLSALREEMMSLQKEAAPFLELAPYLGWIPTYGGDLKQAPALLEMGLQLSITGDEVYQAAAPILPEIIDNQSATSIPELLSALQNANVQLLAAQVALSRARIARQRVQTDHLSERTRKLLNDKIDPLLLAMQGAFPVDDLFMMARIAPRLLGAAGNGPQTYLLLLQNEDELRPTGGYLTAAGRLAIEDGQISQLYFENSNSVDDFSKPYPSTPWQLDEYMRSEIFLFRDSNWFTNFPTTVEWAEFLYAYTRPEAIDGVIAIDQHAIVEILRVVGPIKVEEENELITSANVLQYMRSARWEGIQAVRAGEDLDHKQFINRMSDPLMRKLLSRQEYSLSALIQVLLKLLDEKHILLQFDDPEMKELLAKRGWDGVVRPPAKSDYLMVVDTNVGFNKTNLVVDTALVYEVDLREITQPKTRLELTYTNNAQVNIPCYQIPFSMGIVIEQEYPVNDCFWTYLRVYTPAGSELIGSTPRAVPAGLTLREAAVPARTDILGNENIPGVSVYGTLIVVPAGETLSTNFELGLPQSVLEGDPQTSTWTYRLTVQKQPGTLAVPLTLHLLLPPSTQVTDSSQELKQMGEDWMLETDLRQDLNFYAVFTAAD